MFPCQCANCNKLVLINSYARGISLLAAKSGRGAYWRLFSSWPARLYSSSTGVRPPSRTCTTRRFKGRTTSSHSFISLFFQQKRFKEYFGFQVNPYFTWCTSSINVKIIIRLAFFASTTCVTPSVEQLKIRLVIFCQQISQQTQHLVSYQNLVLVQPIFISKHIHQCFFVPRHPGTCQPVLDTYLNPWIYSSSRPVLPDKEKLAWSLIKRSVDWLNRLFIDEQSIAWMAF